MQNTFKVVGFIIVLLVVSACSANFDANIEDGNLVVATNFSLTETLLNSGESHALSFNEVELIQNASYDIQDGQLVVSGDLLCEDNSRQEGSITVEMSVTEDDFIDVQITDVQSDCDGIESSLIDQVKEEMASGLAEAAQELQDSEATVTFTEVTLADDRLTIGLEVVAPLNNNN